MNTETALALTALLAFQLKHLLCDFVLQTRFQVADKGFYGHVGGLIHAACHALLTIPALLILTHSPLVIAAVAAGEFVVHYHTDWLKARTERVRNWKESDDIYWIAFGADQLVHQVTYIVIVAIVLRIPAV